MTRRSRGQRDGVNEAPSTRPRANYVFFSARSAIQSPTMCLLVCLADCVLIRRQEGSRDEQTAIRLEVKLLKSLRKWRYTDAIVKKYTKV